MKKSIFSIAILSIFAIANVYAVVSVPTEVSSSFIKKYPRVREVSWIQVDAQTYEADYMFLNNHFHTFFDATGNVIENDYVLNYSSLPDKVHYYVMTNLKGMKIQEVVSPLGTHDATHYLVKGELDGVHYFMAFRADGELLKLESK